MDYSLFSSSDVTETTNNFQEIANYVGDRRPSKIMDLWCGRALIDAMFYKKYNCAIHLVDVEQGRLKSAWQFLHDNGVPHVQATNPNIQPLYNKDVDIIVSLSGTEPFPLTAYAEFARLALKAGGIFVLDINEGEEQNLSAFSRLDTIRDGKRRRVAAVK